MIRRLRRCISLSTLLHELSRNIFRGLGGPSFPASCSILATGARQVQVTGERSGAVLPRVLGPAYLPRVGNSGGQRRAGAAETKKYLTRRRAHTTTIKKSLTPAGVRFTTTKPSSSPTSTTSTYDYDIQQPMGGVFTRQLRAFPRPRLRQQHNRHSLKQRT